ncbi:hypothetical protein L208DRAFT_1339590, partial [Tricholoma matsutake]
PCLWQLQIIQSILQRKNDVVSIAGTGMGKTLVFWIPILFRPPGSVQIVVTPLNLLGSQNVSSLERAGIRAGLYYQAVITSPEQLMKEGGPWQKLPETRRVEAV